MNSYALFTAGFQQGLDHEKLTEYANVNIIGALRLLSGVICLLVPNVGEVCQCTVLIGPSWYIHNVPTASINNPFIDGVQAAMDLMESIKNGRYQ